MKRQNRLAISVFIVGVGLTLVSLILLSRMGSKNELDENKTVTDWEQWCLARMHKNGWFKPEEVPIIYEEPNGMPDGVYLWTRDKEGGPLKFEDAPEEIKARAKGFKEKLNKAVKGLEVVRITKALETLHRPYQRPGMNVDMHLGNIPPSWKPYFDNIFWTEIQTRHPAEAKKFILPPIGESFVMVSGQQPVETSTYNLNIFDVGGSPTAYTSGAVDYLYVINAAVSYDYSYANTVYHEGAFVNSRCIQGSGTGPGYFNRPSYTSGFTASVLAPHTTHGTYSSYISDSNGNSSEDTKRASTENPTD